MPCVICSSILWRIYSHPATEILELTHTLPEVFRDGWTNPHPHMKMNLLSNFSVEIIVLPCLTGSCLKDYSWWARVLGNAICWCLPTVKGIQIFPKCHQRTKWRYTCFPFQRKLVCGVGNFQGFFFHLPCNGRQSSQLLIFFSHKSIKSQC